MTEGFPETLPEFKSRFGSEDACRHYLFTTRWPGGFICPACHNRKSWPTARGTYCCTACGRHTSLTAGTIMHRSHIPLTKWFLAMWLICAASETGINARQLQRDLDIGSYKSAWLMLQKLRQAMSIIATTPLSGAAEVGITCVGSGMGTPVLIAIQIQSRKASAVRMRHVDCLSPLNLKAFIRDCIKEGSTVSTNIKPPFSDFELAEYKCNCQSEVSPHMQRMAALLKKWLSSTHQGRVNPKHLQRYLEEFAFRFNNYGRSEHPGDLFERLIGQVMIKQASSYQSIISNPS